MKKTLLIISSILIVSLFSFSLYFNCFVSDTSSKKINYDSIAVARDSLFVANMVEAISCKQGGTPLDSLTIIRINELIPQRVAGNLEGESLKEYILQKSIDDCRQETNNIINKINGWLGFWMALLAIIGTLLPVLMAIKNANEAENRLKEHKDELKEALLSQMNVKINECNKLLDDLNLRSKDLKNLEKKFCLETEKSKIVSLANCIYTIGNMSVLKSHPSIRALMRDLLYQLFRDYGLFVKEIKKAHEDKRYEDYSKEVLVVFIHIELALIKSQIIYTDISINRAFVSLLSTIKKIIEEMAQYGKTPEDLIRDLEKVYTCFPTFLYRL